MKHSPTPWSTPAKYLDMRETPVIDATGTPVVSLADDGACGDPDCCGSPTFHIEVSAADLAFIIHACNAHESYRKAVEAARSDAFALPSTRRLAAAALGEES